MTNPNNMLRGVLPQEESRHWGAFVKALRRHRGQRDHGRRRGDRQHLDPGPAAEADQPCAWLDATPDGQCRRVTERAGGSSVTREVDRRPVLVGTESDQ
jgi:hypothetical protein